MAEIDYYKILGVSKEANASQIKASYQLLAKKFHLDHVGDKGYARFLLDQIVGYSWAKERDNVFVSVASDKPESQAFFQKHGFVSKDQIEVAYQEGNIETIYTKELKYNVTI